MKTILCILFTVIVETTLCPAQSVNSQMVVPSWGDSVCGVQISIAATNKEFVTGSTVVLKCQINNLSTNVVGMRYTGLSEYDFSVSLWNDSGTLYDLKPDNSEIPRPITTSTVIGINPNEIYKRDIPVYLGSSIPPGNYKLNVKVAISVKKQWHALSSNSLEVQVTKPSP